MLFDEYVSSGLDQVSTSQRNFKKANGQEGELKGLKELPKAGG